LLWLGCCDNRGETIETGNARGFVDYYAELRIEKATKMLEEAEAKAKLKFLEEFK
jgi:hypothetical protein